MLVVEGAIVNIKLRFLLFFLTTAVLAGQVDGYTKTTVLVDSAMVESSLTETVLSQLDQFIGPSSFEEALTCHSQAEFFSPVQKAELSCDKNGCFAAYQLVESAEGKLEVSECEKDSVSLFSDRALIWDISKQAYDQAKGNMLRLFLPLLPEFFGHVGQTTFSSLQSAEYTLADGRKLPAVHVHGQFQLEGAPRAFPLLVTVVKNVPGVAQIARIRLDKQSWIRLKQFSRKD